MAYPYLTVVRAFMYSVNVFLIKIPIKTYSIHFHKILRAISPNIFSLNL